jgi:hypothetical protein
VIRAALLPAREELREEQVDDLFEEELDRNVSMPLEV